MSLYKQAQPPRWWISDGLWKHMQVRQWHPDFHDVSGGLTITRSTTITLEMNHIHISFETRLRIKMKQCEMLVMTEI